MIEIQGNPRNRDTLRVKVELQDGSHMDLSYRDASITEAFEEYCEKITIGKVLSLSNQEILDYTRENTPREGQTVQQLIDALPERQRTTVNEIIYVTVHHWASPNWSVYDDPDTLPPEVRNREPLLI